MFAHGFDSMDLFSKIAHRYDKFVGSFDLDKIIDYLPLQNQELLIDLGGGTGRVAKSLQEHVNGCIVLDKSFEMIQQAKISSNKLMLIQGLSEALPFRTNSVKQIFLNDALHHIRKQKETLQECYRILAPKGKLIIREFDRNYFWNKFLIMLEKVLRFGSKFLTPKELECMCLELNFTVYWQKPTKGTFILVAEKVD